MCICKIKNLKMKPNYTETDVKLYKQVCNFLIFIFSSSLFLTLLSYKAIAPPTWEV